MFDANLSLLCFCFCFLWFLFFFFNAFFVVVGNWSKEGKTSLCESDQCKAVIPYMRYRCSVEMAAATAKIANIEHLNV